MFKITEIRFTTDTGTEEAVSEFFDRETGFTPRLVAATHEGCHWQFGVVMITDTATLASVFSALETELDTPKFPGWDRIECGGEEVTVRHQD